MKKIILALSMLGLLVSSAYAEGKKSVYMGVGFGVMAVPEESDAGVGISVKGGMELDNILKNLGMELELQKSIVDPDYHYYYHHNDTNVNILTLAVYATYDIIIPSSAATLRPRFGIILPNLGDTKSVNTRNYGLSSGLDITYKVSQKVKIYTGYTNLGENVNTYLVGMEYHF
jgi:hypothetical protein